MKRLLLAGLVVFLATIPFSVLAQDAWNIDSVQFERDWPDELVGEFHNAQEVLILPWGGMIAAVEGVESEIGIWLKNSEGHWSHRFLPLPTGINRSANSAILATDSSGNPLLVCGTGNGPYASSDSGLTWYPFNGLSPQQMSEGENPWFETSDILEVGPGQFWAADAFKGPAYTADYGQHWEFIGTGLNHRNPAVFNTNDLFLDHNGQVWLQGEDAVYRLVQTNRDDTRTWSWKPLVDGIEYNLVDGRQRCQPQLATWPGGYCDDGNGLMYLWSGWGLIWRSDDFGENWEQMTTDDDEWPDNYRGTVVPTMIVNQAGLVFFGVENGGLYVSADSADNWQPVWGDTTSQYNHWRSWHDWIGGILDLTFDLDGYLVIGTWDGVIRSTIPMNGLIKEPQVAVIEPNLTPLTFSLSAYPNPFNGFAVINLALPMAGYADLRIYDAVGRQAVVLAANQKFNSGTYCFPWNASGLPTGVYFLVLRSLGKGGVRLNASSFTTKIVSLTLTK